MRVVLRPALMGRKTVNVMTKKPKHSPEQFVRKIQEANRVPFKGAGHGCSSVGLNAT